MATVAWTHFTSLQGNASSERRNEVLRIDTATGQTRVLADYLIVEPGAKPDASGRTRTWLPIRE